MLMDNPRPPRQASHSGPAAPTPSRAIARHRAREPEPNPGTVAFPSAPLVYRSPIYTTCGVGNPPGSRNRVKGTREAGRCHHELPDPRDGPVGFLATPSTQT